MQNEYLCPKRHSTIYLINTIIQLTYVKNSSIVILEARFSLNPARNHHSKTRTHTTDQNILHNVLEISFFSHLFRTPSFWSTDPYLVVQSTECLVVLLQCGQQLLLSENGSQGLVLTFKTQSNKTIPFLHCSFLNNKCPYSEVDWRRRIQRLNTNNPGFNLLICNTSMNDIPLVEDWSSSLKPSGPAELWKAAAYSQTIGSTCCHWA